MRRNRPRQGETSANSQPLTATAVVYGTSFAGISWALMGGSAVHALLRGLLLGLGMAARLSYRQPKPH